MSATGFHRQTAAEVTDTTGKEGLIVARLTYNPADPLAVNLALLTNRGPIVWTFAHELLRNGTREVTGNGSVRAWPEPTSIDGPRLVLTLISQDQRAQVRLPLTAVHDFLSALDAHASNDDIQATIEAAIDQLVSPKH